MLTIKREGIIGDSLRVAINGKGSPSLCDAFNYIHVGGGGLGGGIGELRDSYATENF